jgi:hypothetical protein
MTWSFVFVRFQKEKRQVKRFKKGEIISMVKTSFVAKFSTFGQL